MPPPTTHPANSSALPPHSFPSPPSPTRSPSPLSRSITHPLTQASLLPSSFPPPFPIPRDRVIFPQLKKQRLQITHTHICTCITGCMYPPRWVASSTKLQKNPSMSLSSLHKMHRCSEGHIKIPHMIISPLPVFQLRLCGQSASSDGDL